MSIKIVNNIPNLKFSINDDGVNTIITVVTEEDGCTLGEVPCGKVCKIGSREFLALGHGKDTTAVITNSTVGSATFGESGDYAKSNVRKYCNGEFYNRLAEEVGRKNIFTHTVSLKADDGTGKDKFVKDKISVLTTDNYRKYREYLKPSDKSYWTATRMSWEKEGDCDVCYINSNGLVYSEYCFSSSSIRPFCILNSSILVSM